MALQVSTTNNNTGVIFNEGDNFFLTDWFCGLVWFGLDFPKLSVEEEKNARSCKLAQPTTQDL